MLGESSLTSGETKVTCLALNKNNFLFGLEIKRLIVYFILEYFRTLDHLGTEYLSR